MYCLPDSDVTEIFNFFYPLTCFTVGGNISQDQSFKTRSNEINYKLLLISREGGRFLTLLRNLINVSTHLCQFSLHHRGSVSSNLQFTLLLWNELICMMPFLCDFNAYKLDWLVSPCRQHCRYIDILNIFHPSFSMYMTLESWKGILTLSKAACLLH